MVGFLLGVALPARADAGAPSDGDQPPMSAPSGLLRPTDHPLSLNVVAGLGSEVGELGMTAEYSVLDRLALGVGAGKGFGGAQFAALARFRVALFQRENTVQSFDLVGAFSEGKYATLFDDDSGFMSEHAYWAEYTIDYELQTRVGFRLTAGLGFSQRVAATDVVVEDGDGAPSPLPATVISTRLTVGWAL
jgi:hypothetical protein